MDAITVDGNTLQSYVLLTSHQMQKISELFEVYDRDGISRAVQTIVEEYIKEHDRNDVVKLQTDNAWDDFKAKFDEGWFNERH